MLRRALVGAPVTVATSPLGATNFSCLPCGPAVWGVFNANQITATGRPVDPLPNILGSTSFQINAGEGGTLRVFVTSQNNTDVSSNWISSFTSNSLPTGWSVREQTFIDTANGLFTTTGATVTQLGDHLFNAIGTNVAAALAAFRKQLLCDAPLYDRLYRYGIRTFDYHPSYPDPWRITALCRWPARPVGSGAEAQSLAGKGRLIRSAGHQLVPAGREVGSASGARLTRPRSALRWMQTF